MSKKKKWFMLVQDNESHDYVIPVEKLEAWWAFCADDERLDSNYNLGIVPDFATRCGGSIKFPSWENL